MILATAPTASVVLSLAAAAAYAAPATGLRLGERGGRSALLAAWVLHGMVLVWSLLGEAPRFGWAQALSFTGWLVLTVYVVEQNYFPQLQARWALAVLGAAALLPPLVFPGRPILSHSPWLPVHTALGIASYGMVAAAVIHAWLMRRAERDIRQAGAADAGVPVLTLERLTFRFTTIGFALLTATLLAGLASGSFRFDHKTVLTALAWLVFAMLLLGRARFGWRGRRAVRMLYSGSLLLLLAYVGSRFVLEVILGKAA